MGRTLKRVPLDFSWPIRATWRGYCNPYSPTECRACGGSGYNPATRAIADDFYDFARTGRQWCDKITQDEVAALIAEGRLHDFTHRFEPGKGWVKIEPEPVVSANAVNEWSRGGMGHDALNRIILIEARATRLGVYGKCAACDGHGYYFCDEKFRALSNQWVPTEPPTGDGFQLWETTSGGSPISPVFATLDALCEWAAENATTLGDFRASAAEWLAMLKSDRVMHREGNAVFL
jgi:hypothetical protein